MPEWNACTSVNQLSAAVVEHLVTTLQSAKDGVFDHARALQLADEALGAYRGIALQLHERSPVDAPRSKAMLKAEDIPPPLDSHGEGYKGPEPVLAPPLFGRGGRGGGWGGGVVASPSPSAPPARRVGPKVFG